MATEKPESDPVLAMIEAKIAAWQAVADRYRAALAVESGQLGDIDVSAFTSQTPGAGRTPNNAPVDLPTGAFRNTGVAEAIRIYLAAARRKRTVSEIAAALTEGGLVSTAKDFERSLLSTLHRLRESGELLQFKDGWDLAASYPEALRQRLTQGKESVPKRKRKGKKKADRVERAAKSEPKAHKAKRAKVRPPEKADATPSQAQRVA